MLKLRSIGINDYSVLEGRQRIVGHRTHALPLALERHHPPARRPPMGSAKDLDTATAEFKAAWAALKARTPPSLLAAAYKAMNIRDDG